MLKTSPQIIEDGPGIAMVLTALANFSNRSGPFAEFGLV
jgi:hypothetical protein